MFSVFNFNSVKLTNTLAKTVPYLLEESLLVTIFAFLSPQNIKELHAIKTTSDANWCILFLEQNVALGCTVKTTNNWYVRSETAGQEITLHTDR